MHVSLIEFYILTKLVKVVFAKGSLSKTKILVILMLTKPKYKDISNFVSKKKKNWILNIKKSIQ